MRLSTIARLGATGIAVGIASYLPLASSVSTQPAGAIPNLHGSFANCGYLPHGHLRLFDLFCDHPIAVSDVAAKENIVPVVW